MRLRLSRPVLHNGVRHEAGAALETDEAAARALIACGAAALPPEPELSATSSAAPPDAAGTERRTVKTR